MNATRECYKITEEMFASPLNYNIKLICYCSAHRRDSLMRAGFDSYSEKNRGCIQMHPEYIPDELYKALRWTTAASLKPETFCAVAIYPRWKRGMRTSLLSHPNVNLVCSFQKPPFRFCPRNTGNMNMPKEWRGGGCIVEISKLHGRRMYQTHAPALTIFAAAEEDGAVTVTRLDLDFIRRESTFHKYMKSYKESSTGILSDPHKNAEPIPEITLCILQSFPLILPLK